MPIKKQSKTLKKENNQEWNGDKNKIPKKGEFFIVKKNGIEGKVLKVTTSGEITVFIGGEEKVILNLNLWKQIDQEKGYFKKPKTKKEKNIEISEIEKVLDNPTEVYIEYEEDIEGIPRRKEVLSENIGETLTKRQQKFCELYATNIEFFGNGVQAYLEVYDIDTIKPGWYKTACAGASRMLSNVKVCERINELLQEKGLNDEFVDKQLLFLITQNADLGVKIRSIAEYNSLRARIQKGLQKALDDGTVKENVLFYIPKNGREENN